MLENNKDKGEYLIDDEEKVPEQNLGNVPVYEKEIKFINMNEFKNQNFNDDNSDYKELLHIKKNNLIYEFDRLKKETSIKKSIFDLNIKDNIEENNYYNNKEISKDDCCCCKSLTFLAWNFNLIGPLFVIFNLIGVYQLINIFNATKNEMIFGIKSFFLENITRHSNNNNSILVFDNLNNNNKTEVINELMENFENLCFQNLPDFNLLFLTSGIGNLLLKFYGYRISTIIFVVINVLLVFLYPSIDFPQEKYSDIYSLLLIILYFLLIFISVGGISLFSQQIFFEGLIKYIDLKNDKKINKNFIYFYYLIFTSIISYIIYLVINYLLRKYLYENFFIYNIYIFSTSFVVSIIIYQIYSIPFTKVKKKEKGNSKDIYRVCGYLIYCEVRSLKNNENIKENNNNFKIKDKENNKNNEEGKKSEKNKDDGKDKNNENIEENINIINNEIENMPEKVIKNNEERNNLLDEINKINIENVEKKEIRCVSCKLCLKKFFQGVENSNLLTMVFLCDGERAITGDLPEGFADCGFCDFGNLPFCLMSCCNCEDKCEICNCCYYSQCFCRNCYHNFCRIWYIFWASFFCILCSPLCFCCYCNALCGDSKVNELHQNEEKFCYCYKIQRKGSWFCDLLFKNNLLEIIVINVFLEMLIIGFGKQIEINLKDNSIFDNFIMIIIYSVCFFIIALFNRIQCFDDDNKGDLKEQLCNLFGLTFLNCFIVSLFSGFCLFGNDGLKNFTNNYLILLPYAITKFYYFILINSLVKDLDKGNMDLLSSSAIISSFLLVYKLIASIFTDFLETSLYALYFFQFIFGLVVSYFTLIIIFFNLIYWTLIIITCLWICLICRKPLRKTKKRKKFFFSEI